MFTAPLGLLQFTVLGGQAASTWFVGFLARGPPGQGHSPASVSASFSSRPCHTIHFDWLIRPCRITRFADLHLWLKEHILSLLLNRRLATCNCFHTIPCGMLTIKKCKRCLRLTSPYCKSLKRRVPSWLLPQPTAEAVGTRPLLCRRLILCIST